MPVKKYPQRLARLLQPHIRPFIRPHKQSAETEHGASLREGMRQNARKALTGMEKGS